MADQIISLPVTDETDVRIPALQLFPLGSVADHIFAARQIQPEESLHVLLDSDSSGEHENGPSVADTTFVPWKKQFGVHASRPLHQAPVALASELVPQGIGGYHHPATAAMEPAQVAAAHAERLTDVGFPLNFLPNTGQVDKPFRHTAPPERLPPRKKGTTPTDQGNPLVAWPGLVRSFGDVDEVPVG